MHELSMAQGILNAVLDTAEATNATVQEINARAEAAADTYDNDACKKALKLVVPTYHSPKEVNETADDAEEMKHAR